MKTLLSLLTILMLSVASMAQEGEDPVQWTQELISTGEGEYELVMKGSIAEGWHVYSQFTAEGGSLPSEFTYVNAGEEYELVGGTLESKTQKAYSEIFEVEETFFKKEAIFRQKVRLLNPGLKQIQVELFYQVCKEVCIPKDVVFYFSLDGEEIIV
ncbi:protein-disulfide reductase DsbD domain-containing protein, partial [Muriicola sp.]